MQRRKFFLLISLIIILSLSIVTAAFSLSAKNPSNEANQLQLNNVFKNVGNFLRGNKDKLQVDKGDIIAKVNNIPIYKSEFELRKGLTLASDAEISNIDNYILNKLVREKVEEYLASSYNLKVSQDEINSYIEKEKKEFADYPEANQMLQEMISASGMTSEEYWNTYEKYNVKRLLLLDKLYNTIINNGIRSGKLEKTNSTTFSPQSEYKNYVDNIIEQYVKQSKISINDKYKDMFKDFTVN
ncbi:SurA N-terminal domain-containing protein [Thermoanaerobacterium thermosaccharolyticum]